MRIVENCGGTALYLNGVLVGWVCRVIGDKYVYFLQNYKNPEWSQEYDTRHQALIGLMSIFGE